MASLSSRLVLPAGHRDAVVAARSTASMAGAALDRGTAVARCTHAVATGVCCALRGLLQPDQRQARYLHPLRAAHAGPCRGSGAASAAAKAGRATPAGRD